MTRVLQTLVLLQLHPHVRLFQQVFEQGGSGGDEGGKLWHALSIPRLKRQHKQTKMQSAMTGITDSIDFDARKAMCILSRLRNKLTERSWKLPDCSSLYAFCAGTELEVEA